MIQDQNWHVLFTKERCYEVALAFKKKNPLFFADSAEVGFTDCMSF